MDDERDSAAAPVSCGDDMMSCVWETRREQDDCARSEVSATSSRRSAASCRSMDQMADLAALEARRRFAAEEAEIERKRVASEAEMERIRLASEAEMERIRLASEAELNQLRLDRDIAVSRARLQVYAKYENDEQEMVSSNRQTEPQKMRIHEHLQVAGADPIVHSVRQLPNMTLESHQGDDTKPLASIQQQQRHDMEKMMSEQKRHDLVSSLGQYSTLGMGRRDRDNPGRDECRFVEMPIQRQSGFEIVNSITGIDKVVESLNETMKRSQLPRLDLPVFNGDELDFQQWLVSFERIIEENTSDPARRLHYLVQYTAGNANTLVSGYLLDPTNGYQAAKRELKKEYGDPYVLSRAYLRKIEMWRPIQLNDIDALKTFAIFLKKCRGSMPSLRHLQQLNTDHYLQTIVMKLPQTLQTSWRKSVHVIEENCKDVMFEDLVKFIDQQWQIAKHPVFSADALQEAESKVKSGKHQFNLNKGDRKTLLATNLAPTRAPESVIEHASDHDVQTSSCQLCHSSHDLDDCRAYIGQSLEDRKKFLIQNRMCFACYGPMSSKHNARLCDRRRVCRVCGNSHPTGLHGLRIESRRQQNHENHSSDLNTVNPDNRRDVHNHATTCVTDAGVNSMIMSIVMVRLSNDMDPSREITVYAALDSMSTASFISEDVWKYLGSPGEPTEISIKTVTDERRQSTNVVRNLSVMSTNNNKRIKLPKVYTQDVLPFDVNDVPSHEVVRRWPHLRCLVSEIPDLDRSVPVGLLIGVDCPGALQPCDVIPSVDNGPFAIKTAVGWCISGPKQQHGEKISFNDVTPSCYFVKMSDKLVKTTETGLKDMIFRMYEHDFNESASEMVSSGCLSGDLTDARALSQDDRKFLEKMNDESRFVNGHYELPLPFRHQDVHMPNNRLQAMQRIQGIRRRFTRDQVYRENYITFMKELIDKGYARRVPIGSLNKDFDGRCWYLPHHGVYHPQKPGKYG